LWENRITRMREAEIWDQRIDEVLVRLERPTLMVRSGRAASGPQMPRQLFDKIATKDKRCRASRRARTRKARARPARHATRGRGTPAGPDFAT
jgi:hypothetical protein